MGTKTKTFDAIEMSRRLREQTSRKLDAMTREERLAYLKAVGERWRAEIRERQGAASQ